MNTFLIKYEYSLKKPSGKLKVKKELATVRLDAEPEHLYKNKKLHQYLGGEAQKLSLLPVVSVEIKNITKTAKA